MLRSQHGRITGAHGKGAAGDRGGVRRASVAIRPTCRPTNSTLSSRKYDVEHIYFINRSHKVFQTNLPYDMNLVFPESDFTKFLDTVYGKRQGHERRHRHVVGDRHAADLQLLRTQGQRLHHRNLDRSALAAWSNGDFGWMGKYFFEDIFTDAVRSNEYVKDVDIYLINAAGHLVAAACRAEARSGTRRTHRQDRSRRGHGRRRAACHDL